MRLKLGIFPINPAKIEATYSGNLSFLEKETSINVEISNNLNEDAVYKLDIPGDEQVLLAKQTFTLEVPARGRKIVSVPLTVKQHGFYKPELTITATKKRWTKAHLRPGNLGCFQRAWGKVRW